MPGDDSESGRKASFDPETGAVRGTGSGAGGGGNPDEDYDADPHGGGAESAAAPGSGHPLPASGEARHGEIPESAERQKGRGDDSPARNQPDCAVTPEGEPYRYAAPGRGPEGDELRRDQAEHQDRGQSVAATESDRH